MQTFTQVSNQENDLNSIEVSYQDRFAHDLWLADALQKDAIQNSWDARQSRKGENWNCTFSYINSDVSILVISDYGTSGLVGNKFSDIPEMIELLKSPASENLARFLNSNWSAKNSESGGKWGRGKNIFLISSQNREFYFDSFRMSDDSYIFGKVYLDKEEKLIKYTLSWNEEAKTQKTLHFPKLDSLKECGTRIIIPNPRNEILRAMRSGKMLEFVGNTRWEIIEKYNAEIFIQFEDNLQKAKVPSWYKEEFELKHCINKFYGSELIRADDSLRIKKLVLAFNPSNEIPDNIKGVAIQRGGMTIERVRTRELLNIEQSESVYGWLELDKELEAEMYELENVEHTGFKWFRNPAKNLKEYLRRKVKEFALENKLLEDERQKSQESRRTAEQRALRNLIPLFKKLELSRKGHSSGGTILNKRKRMPDEPLRLSAIEFDLPRSGDQRVNSGENLSNVYAIPINNSMENVNVIVRTFRVSEDGTFNKMIEERNFNLSPGTGPKIGVEKLPVTHAFKKGKYFFRAKLLCLEDTNILLPDNKKVEKGYEYDRVNIPFYINEDPPILGNLPFQFSEITNRTDPAFLFEWDQQALGIYTIYYNGMHPKIKSIKKEDEAVKSSESMEKFLTENAVLIAYQIKLEEVVSGDNKGDKDLAELISSGDLTRVANYLMSGYSEFLWEYMGGK
ncbi:MAG: hypothetical protein CEN89_127 [Candidatus Berkelbacteria bacterium Licking1014_7]|uniref:Uncharacterized protein n=1 Tax=Candidatus Berkelbacteria bacterium Licking1014_7 TaxID=2017147 RepID=A0A554LKI8_9BACT|nr:MAG: hypothetical protein CEN89_127 [Candidatus Berkelbacteria bacterium Licking1014_7]